MKKPEMIRAGKELAYSLIIDAPKELVWNTRINPDLVPKYFMTDKIATKSYTSDFRVGGEAKLIMTDQKGKERTNDILYLEIKPNRRARYELLTDFLPGKKLMAEESVEDYMDGTMYKVKLDFEEAEDLYRMMDVGWHLLFREYIARFGALVEEMNEEASEVK